MSDPSILDAKVLGWIAGETGGKVVEARLVASGGRLGYHIDVQLEGKLIPLFLQRGRTLSQGSFMSPAGEAEVLRALHAVDVKVPRVWGVSEEFNALLTERLDGEVWFQEPRDAEQRASIAQDFMRQIARWHSVAAQDMKLPSFWPIRSVREHQQEQLADIRKSFEAANAVAPIDALAWATLDFLESSIPAYDGPAVLCQGDTGPGNFIYLDDRVLGVIDWELAHIGDPMDDIAWLSWRATQHGFPDFPACLREYERLSGIPVDPERVRYYRVNACARLGPWFGLADMGNTAGLYRVGDVDKPQDNERTADGSQMIMTMLHRRMRLEALGVALRLELPSRFVTGEAPPPEHAAMYDNVLGQLQILAPGIADKKASGRVKGIARKIKYLKEVDRNFRLFEQQELREIGHLLGRDVHSTAAGRPALAQAARDHTVDLKSYFLYQWNRMVRDDHLMRTASGRMFERSWPPLA